MPNGSESLDGLGQRVKALENRPHPNPVCAEVYDKKIKSIWTAITKVSSDVITNKAFWSAVGIVALVFVTMVGYISTKADKSTVDILRESHNKDFTVLFDELKEQRNDFKQLNDNVLKVLSK